VQRFQCKWVLAIFRSVRVIGQAVSKKLRFAWQRNIKNRPCLDLLSRQFQPPSVTAQTRVCRNSQGQASLPTLAHPALERGGVKQFHWPLRGRPGPCLGLSDRSRVVASMPARMESPPSNLWLASIAWRALRTDIGDHAVELLWVSCAHIKIDGIFFSFKFFGGCVADQILSQPANARRQAASLHQRAQAAHDGQRKGRFLRLWPKRQADASHRFTATR